MEGRPTSILTNSLIEFLQGEEKPNPSEYRKRVRRRLTYGIHDLALLNELLDEDELREVFGPHFADEIKAQDEAQGNIPQIHSARPYVPEALRFLLWGMDSGEPIYPPYDEPQPAFSGFTEALEKGAKKYLSEKKGISANVDVTIELSNVDRVEELYDC